VYLRGTKGGLTLALLTKWGTRMLPPLSAAVSGRVLQMRCLTPASLAHSTVSFPISNSLSRTVQKSVTT